MKPTNIRKLKFHFSYKRVYAPLLLVIIIALVYSIVVFDNWATTIISLSLGAGIFLAYFKNSNFRMLISDSLHKDKNILFLVGLMAIIAIPFTLRTQPYIIHILIIAQISMILALGLNFQVGSTGIPNLGYAAFYGVGAYTSALLSTKFGFSFWVSILLAGWISALFGWLVGLPTLKTRTYHMALVSIAFGLVTYIMLNNVTFTGGPNGIKNIQPPVIFGWSLFSSLRIFDLTYPVQFNFYYFILIFVILSFVISKFIFNSQVGLFFNAVREDEIAAKCSGINTSTTKLLAFSLGAFLAGIAGSLYAHYIGYISPENFNMNTSLQVLGMVIMGGMDNILGIGIGAFIISVAPEKFRSLADFRMLATGLIILIMLMFRPSGIIKQQIRFYSRKHLKIDKTAQGESHD